MVESIMLGSLYFDGVPQEVGAGYSFKVMSLGDTVSGKEIWWLKLKSGAMIADKCVCVNVSWDQLNENHLVFGALAQINGRPYLCRCPKVGSRNYIPNEWDDLLNKVGINLGTTNWKQAFFWGQEAPGTGSKEAAYRVVRGHESARYWGMFLSTNQFNFFGFRPVLEPLMAVPEDFEPLLGQHVTAMGPGWENASGILAAYSDYDLMLKSPAPLPDACTWAVPAGKHIIVDRASVSWLRKTENN